ncbi:MAG: GNAT family N-acetyltransferase [Dehalococcoidia bacterium]
MTDYPPSAWEGELVRLRAVEPADWERFFADGRDTDSARMGWQIGFPRSSERAKQWTNERATIDGHDTLQFFWAIETLTGTLAGSCNTHGVDHRNGHFEYGIDIFREHRGHGYAGDAILIMLRFYFEELRFNKANATVFAFNEGSLALHRKLGFIEEGRIRANVYTDGAYHDEHWFGMTASEFRELKRGENSG